MRLLLGIDVGTQGTKTALYDETGECLSEAFEASQPHRPAPGLVEENPESQLGAALPTIRACLKQSRRAPSDIAAVAVGGQMAGVIGVGADGLAVTHYDSWLDTRCAPQIAVMQRDAGDEILEKCGNVPSFNHGPKILWWKQKQPNQYARIRAFVQPGAYVAMRLCGLDAAHAFIDDTYIHFSGFADNRRRVWDPELCRRFEIDPAKLPAIVAPESVVGGVTTAMAADSGLRTGTPVVAGCGDTSASFLAAGAASEGICIDVAGTASVFGATTYAFLADRKGRLLGCGRAVIPGLWHPYAYINGGGQNLEWFQRVILGCRMDLAALDAEAADSTHDSYLPFFVPHLGGRVSPAWPDLRGGWVNVSWDAKPCALYRSILESVALEYALYRNALVAAIPGFVVRELRVTGGGEKSRVWNQLKADRLQARVVSIARSGGAPMGLALLAGRGAGVFADLAATVDKWVGLGAVFAPDVTAGAVSDLRARRYGALLNSLHQWSGGS